MTPSPLAMRHPLPCKRNRTALRAVQGRGDEGFSVASQPLRESSAARQATRSTLLHCETATPSTLEPRAVRYAFHRSPEPDPNREPHHRVQSRVSRWHNKNQRLHAQTLVAEGNASRQAGSDESLATRSLQQAWDSYGICVEARGCSVLPRPKFMCGIVNGLVTGNSHPPVPPPSYTREGGGEPWRAGGREP